MGRGGAGRHFNWHFRLFDCAWMTRVSRVNDQIRERMPDCLITCLAVRQCIPHSTRHATPTRPVTCLSNAPPIKLVQVAFTKIKANTQNQRNAFPFRLFALLGGENGNGKMRENVSQFIALSFGFSLKCLTISFHLFSIALFTFSAFQFVLYLLLPQKGWPRIAGQLTVRKGEMGRWGRWLMDSWVQEINEI